MGIETGLVCRDCEAFQHLSKLYFPREWTEGLVEEQLETDAAKSHLRDMMTFMRRHQSHNIALLDEHSGEWGDAIRYDD